MIPDGEKTDVTYDEVQAMSKMMTTAEIVKDHRIAAAKAMTKALRTKKTAIAFLQRAGILDKSGKRLAKPYR
jgi:hypothetical protein